MLSPLPPNCLVIGDLLDRRPHMRFFFQDTKDRWAAFHEICGDLQNLAGLVAEQEAEVRVRVGIFRR